MDALEIVAIFIGIMLYLLIILFYYAMIFLSRAIIIFSYVMQGIGLSTMAKNRGIEKPWLAWVPMVNSWLLGKISDQYREKVTGEDPNLRQKILIRKIIWVASEVAIVMTAILWYVCLIFGMIIAESAGMNSEAVLMPMMPLFVIVLMLLLVAFIVVCVFYCISQYRALFDIFRSSDPKTSTMFFVLSFFSQVALTLGIFLNRRKTLGMPSEQKQISDQ